jgi:hypothetical protein
VSSWSSLREEGAAATESVQYTDWTVANCSTLPCAKDWHVHDGGRHASQKKKSGKGGEIDEATSIEAHRKPDHEKCGEIKKHEGQLAKRGASEFAGQKEVVGGCPDRVDISARRLVQEGRDDDCAKPGFEEGVAEGAGIRDADADLLCEPCREEPEREPAAGAGACEGTAAPKN